MRISIAIPLLNEEAVLPELLRRVMTVLDATPDGPHELVVVDDGSTDGTPELLADAVAGDRRIRVVRLSRNFGHQAAISAALDWACPGDLLLVAGKGHETYQIIGREAFPFDDRAAVRQILAERAQ